MRPVLALAALLLCASARAAFRTEAVHDPKTGRPLGTAVEGQILVKYRRGAEARLQSASAAKLSAAKLGELGAIGWTHLALPPGMTVAQAMARLAGDPDVEAVQPNFVYRPLAAPNDPLYPQQYSLNKIDAPAGWDFETGSSNLVTAAVIDSGIDGAHPDLAANMAPAGRHMTFDPATGAGSAETPVDTCGHGTNAAGVLAAVGGNGVGITGVSWSAKLLSLRVFNGTGPDQCGTTSDVTIANAIAYAVALATTPASGAGRVVINLSLGECPDTTNAASCGTCSAALSNAVQLALQNNVPVVAAAGNVDPANNPFKLVECPAKISGVVAVAATDANDSAAAFSAAGPELSIAAPGVGILTARRSQEGGGYVANSGTSFASPMAAGAVALLLAHVPTLPAQDQPGQPGLLSILEKSADDLGPSGFDTTYGFGRLNLFKALRLAAKGTLSDFAGQSEVIAFPNPAPFSKGAVTFAVPSSVSGSNLSIQLYTITGEPVRSLSGTSWDMRNDAGQPVATGVYIFRVKSDRGSAQGRVAVVH